jgi:hypothetical protein
MGQEALNQRVIVERFDTQGALTTVTNKVSDTLKADADLVREGNLGDILGRYTYQLFDPTAAPGLKVIVFSLGVDLAKAKLERANLDVTYLRDRIALAQQRQRMLTNSESIDAATALQILGDRSKEIELTHTVLQTVEQLRSDSANASALRDLFRVLATDAFLKVLDDQRWEESGTRAAFLEHQQSIRLSAVNAAEQEALISRGLESLLAYQRGGLTEERLANFVRIAQAAAMAYIGAQVN